MDGNQATTHLAILVINKPPSTRRFDIRPGASCALLQARPATHGRVSPCHFLCQIQDLCGSLSTAFHSQGRAERLPFPSPPPPFPSPPHRCHYQRERLARLRSAEVAAVSQLQVAASVATGVCCHVQHNPQHAKQVPNQDQRPRSQIGASLICLSAAALASFASFAAAKSKSSSSSSFSLAAERLGSPSEPASSFSPDSNGSSFFSSAFSAFSSSSSSASRVL